MVMVKRLIIRFNRELLVTAGILAVLAAVFHVPILDRYDTATGHVPRSSLKKYPAGTVMQIQGDAFRRPVLVKMLVNDGESFHLAAYVYGTKAKTKPEKREYTIGHVPLDASAWRKLTKVKIVGHEKVTADELDGYMQWRSDSGGAWSSFEDISPLMSEKMMPEKMS